MEAGDGEAHPVGHRRRALLLWHRSRASPCLCFLQSWFADLFPTVETSVAVVCGMARLALLGACESCVVSCRQDKELEQAEAGIILY